MSDNKSIGELLYQDDNNSQNGNSENELASFTPGQKINGTELWRKQIKELPVLLEGLIPQFGIGMLYGGSDSNKSTFCRGLALAIGAREDSFMRRKLNVKYGRVLFVSSEDDELSASFTLTKYLGDFEDRDIGVDYMFSNDIEHLRKGVSPGEYDLLIVDALGDFFDMDLNSSRVREGLNAFHWISKKNGVPILFVHHESKESERKYSANKSKAYGSVHIEAKMRFAIELSRSGTFRTLQLTKCNVFSDEFKTRQLVMALNVETLSLDFVNEKNGVTFNDAQAFGKKEKAKQKVKEMLKEGAEMKTIIEELSKEKWGSYSFQSVYRLKNELIKNGEV